MTTAKAVVAVKPRSSGWNAPRRPASSVLRSMYVTNAMTGMYMSGELRSSRGGRKPSRPSGEMRCWRDQGLCRQGKSTRASLERT